MSVVERAAVRLADITVPAPPPGPADWNNEGVVKLSAFFADEVLDAYADEWQSENADRPRGWNLCTPYMHHEALRRLCCDGALGAVLEGLIGEPAGVHLNLTGWVTTERDWHADSYLSEPTVGDAYAAVWVALDNIHPDSGPFQYVPGSHRWPQVTRELIGQHFDLADPQWPKLSESMLSPLFSELIEGHDVVSYLPQRGDVLVWHGRLLHRGSKANVPGMTRPALIAHYSGIHHRPAMPTAVQHENGGWFFPIINEQPVHE